MSGPHDWLRERADDLLARADPADLAGYLTAYDNLLWAVVTASRDELGEFVQLLWADPYVRLPPPIQVTAARLWGLEPPGDPERASTAAAKVAWYCSPDEEEGAATGLRHIAGTNR